MKSLKPCALFVVFSLWVMNAMSQSLITLQPGTYSNRTTDALNNGSDSNPANKTWTFYDYTSGWDSKYYNGNTSKPGYTEGWLRAQWNESDIGGFKMNYRLLFPVGYNPLETYKYPLIIMMHGLGESGTGTATSNDYLNNDKQLIHGGQPHLNAVYLANGKRAEDPTLPSKSFPGFVLFAQQAASQWYYQSQTDMATTILKMVIATYNVDPNRIYIHGLSNGGQAVWYMVRTNPELYAAALPMSGTITAADPIFTSEVNKSVPIPFWMFQGGLDTSPSPNQTNQMVSQLRTAGAGVRYTIYPNIGHGVWGTAYAEPDFFSWMLTHNKSDITVLYQNPTICPTTGAGAKLALGTGFLAYQWEKDGVVISGANTSTYTASVSGSYRARFSRISATPAEGEWNQWSNPVVVTESTPVTPILTTTSSPHLPDINGINSPDQEGYVYTVRVEGPTDDDLDKDWYENGTLQADATSYRTLAFNKYNITNPNLGGPFVQTLKVKPLDGCPSLLSNSIYITTGTPTTLTAPTNLQAQVTSSGSVQLFWTDNANNETGYEIQRATSETGPYTFYKLVGEDIVAYHDTGLIPNTTYYYKIRAVNNTATSSYNSSALVAATSDDTTPPSAPQNLVRITNSISTIKLGWSSATDNSGIKKYIIYYGGTTIDTGSADTTYTVTGLTYNTNYAFTVKAVDNNNNNSQPSNQLLTSTYFTGLDYEHTPDNVGDVNVHSPANSLYGIDWGYYEHDGHVDNVSIAPRVQDNYFNFKFNGYINVPTSGQYYFRVNGNDAANLYLGTPGTSANYANTSTAFTYPGVNSYWSATNSGLTNTNVRSFTFSSSTIIYAATAGGVFKSTYNSGTNTWVWTAMNSGLTNSDVRSITISGSNIFAATAGGIFLSTNGGTSWNAINTGLTNTDVRHIAALSTANYFMASTAGGVFLSTNTGTSWTAVNSGLTNTDVRTIAISGTNIFAGTGGGVFLSTNNGTSWSAKNTGLTNTDIRSITFTGSNFFAGTAAGVFLSVNTGTNWAAINTGLTNTSVRSLAVVANGATNLFAATDSGVYMYSYNITSTWTARPIGLANTAINSIAINGGNIFAATPNGALLSINSGANWASTNRIVAMDGVHDVCTTSAISSNFTLNVGTFYPLSVIYFDLVDDECLTIEYRLTSTGTWQTIPDSWFKTGTPPVLTLPVVPGNLTATIPTTPTDAGMSSIVLNWTHATSTDDFEIYRSTDNVTYAVVATVTTDAVTTFTDTGLTPAKLYYYKLKSINANGSSAFTAPASATTDPDSEAPSVPMNVIVTTNTYTNAGLQWTASTDNVQVAGYKIFANGDLVGTSQVTTFFITTLSPSTAYNFTVKSYDLNGNESAASTAASVITTSPATFYSKSSSDISALASWGINTNGSGTTPTDFSLNGQQFVVRATTTLSNPLTIGGGNSRLVVNSGVTLTLSNKVTGKISVLGTGNLTVNYSAADFNYDFDVISATSNVTFNTYSSLPIEKYGNLQLNGTGVKTIPQGVFEVQGNLTLANGVELKGAAGNGTTLKIGGNLTTGTTTPTVSSDNLLSLQFVENSYHDFTLNSDQSLYSITANESSTVSVVNTSGSFKTIKLGSLNGGGMDLKPGSVFTLVDNDLSLVGASSINPANTTGQLSMNGGDLKLVSTSSSPSHLYFVTGENKIQNFTLQNTGGGLTTIHEPVEIYDGIKIDGGVLNASGNVIIKSNATASASIRQIQNGSITGNVTVERHMDPKGRLYRYLSSPVANVTVADLQNYIPITGSFTGSNTGGSLGSNPSMFSYTEPDYVAFPVSDNTEQLQQGKGYAVYIREDINPTTLISTGVPYQGNVSFTSLLTGSSGQSTDGWNLVGNPYASDVVWNSTAWTSSNVSDVISVSENLPNGALQYRYWNRSGSGSGSLENGKIPSGQAFWIQATTASPSLAITESAKTAEPAANNTEFYRTAARETSDRSFSFELDNGTYKDMAFVKFSEEGADNYSKQHDGAKRANSFFNLSTSSSDSFTLAMNDLSIEFCEKVIPVNIQNATAGSFVLRFNNFDHFNLGTVVLEDKYLSSTQVIGVTNKEFTINIDGQAASYQDRFFLKLSRPSLVTNKSATANKPDFCASEDYVTLTIEDSQPGVNYEAFTTTSVSGKITGTGDAIQIPVAVSALAANQNTISVQASFPGCTVRNLDRTATVNISALPVITGEKEYYGCIGSAMDIKVASSNGTSYKWVNSISNETLAQTTGTLTISELAETGFYTVTTVNDKGCESKPMGILVRADSLTTPVIVLDHDVLKTTSSHDIQWLLNGEVIDGANSSEYTPTVSGSYSVVAKNNYCTKASAPVEYVVTGIGEAGNGQFTLRIYPNPSESGLVNIKGESKNTARLKLQLLDLAGKEKVVKSVSYEEYSNGVTLKEELPAGMYIVRITQDNATLYQKLILR